MDEMEKEMNSDLSERLHLFHTINIFYIYTLPMDKHYIGACY